MAKKFDAVKFQRRRRTEMSKMLSKMSPEEIVQHFKKTKMTKKAKSRRRLTAA